MNNGLFKLDWGSIADAVLMSVVVAVGTAAVSIVSAPNFDVLSLDWEQVGHNMLNLAIIASVLTLGKDLLSTNNGSLLGITPPTTPASQG